MIATYRDVVRFDTNERYRTYVNNKQTLIKHIAIVKLMIEFGIDHICEIHEIDDYDDDEIYEDEYYDDHCENVMCPCYNQKFYAPKVFEIGRLNSFPPNWKW